MKIQKDKNLEITRRYLKARGDKLRVTKITFELAKEFRCSIANINRIVRDTQATFPEELQVNK